MARHKDWWRGWLFSYGTDYRQGLTAGFGITVRADDRTESGRYVRLVLSDKSAENLRNALTEYLARDRSQDALPENIEQGHA